MLILNKGFARLMLFNGDRRQFHYWAAYKMRFLALIPSIYSVHMLLKIYVIIFVLSVTPIFSQSSSHHVPDSLLEKSYDELFNRIKVENDQKMQDQYLRGFLVKAQKEKNWEEIVNGYKNYLHHSERKLRLIYSDSMVYASKKSGDSALIGSAYLTRGIVYYGEKENDKALDYYIKAYDYIKNTQDTYLKNKVKYMIGHIKYYLGYYDQAVRLFEQCIAYFKVANKRAYLNSLHSLALCYNRMGNYGLCSETNTLGLAEAKRLDNHSMDTYFTHSEGINHYHRENYDLAIKTLKETLSFIKDRGDFANVAVAYFYIGRSYWAMRQQEKALMYFKKVDNIFSKRGYIRPDLRENYELLIDYYKNKQNSKTELYYIKQLIKVDSVLNATYKYLSGKIYKEYSTRELVQQQAKIEKLLVKGKRKDSFLAMAGIIVLLFIMYGIYRHYRNRKKFAELMKEINTDKIPAKKKPSNPSKLAIKEEVAGTILKKLDEFEERKEYLQEDLTLVKLAASFNANNRYLSKVIAHYRQKGVVEYINDLKIDHIIQLLKHKKLYRNYTNKALAEEVGFSSTQRFVNAFKRRTGVSPTFFIGEINKGNYTGKSGIKP